MGVPHVQKVGMAAIGGMVIGCVCVRGGGSLWAWEYMHLTVCTCMGTYGCMNLGGWGFRVAQHIQWYACVQLLGWQGSKLDYPITQDLA